MDLTDKLVADFVKAAAPKQERKPEEYTINGVVQTVDNNGMATVLFDGATEATPCQTAVTIAQGDKVIVSVRDRQGVITSNVSKTTINADYLEGGSAKFSGELQAASGTFTGKLSAATGDFKGAVRFNWYASAYDNASIYINDLTQPRPIYLHSPVGDLNTGIEPGLVFVSQGSTQEYCQMSPHGVYPTSDKRLKRNISDLDSDLAKNLRPVSFYFAGANPSDRHYGFIAQEVKNIMPSIIMQNEINGMLALNYTELIAPTLALAQENAREIEALKQEIQQLKGVINELKNNSESSD